MANSQQIKSMWIRLFNQNGSAGKYTKLFDELEQSIQTSIRARSQFNEDELAVLASMQIAGDGFVLTTGRVILFAESNVSVSFDLTSIAEIAPVGFGQISKIEMSMLRIRLCDEREFLLRIEPGPPFFGVWNVLLNAMRRSSNV